MELVGVELLKHLTTLIAAGDYYGAADTIDTMANALHEKAALLRQQADAGFRAPDGIMDRVKMECRGPDGELKQSVDTWRNN